MDEQSGIDFQPDGTQNWPQSVVSEKLKDAKSLKRLEPGRTRTSNPLIFRASRIVSHRLAVTCVVCVRLAWCLEGFVLNLGGQSSEIRLCKLCLQLDEMDVTFVFRFLRRLLTDGDVGVRIVVEREAFPPQAMLLGRRSTSGVLQADR